MAKESVRPRLVFAAPDGKIYDHPDLLMLVRRGREFGLPRPDELTPLPEESELFLLPGRRALGFDPESGEVEVLDDAAVAAFVCPGYTLAGVAAYQSDEGAPVLPLFAYGAVGYANGRLYVAAKRVDEDRRQVFADVNPKRIRKGAEAWMRDFPQNRLVRHLANCALTHCCPAARNLCLGRYEAPLPTARTCNARCVGCLSLQSDDSGFPCTQTRIDFRPEPKEIVEIMERHATREPRPIFSYGQGCEGEPLTEAALLAEATRLYRERGGKGTVNVNTNASLPGTLPKLAEAGFSSMRVSLNSAREPFYLRYYRPNYAFADVRASIAAAKDAGMFVSLNLLFFPGVTDTEEELRALGELVGEHKVDFIQLRNQNLDPELYLGLFEDLDTGAAMGLNNFRKRLRRECPWLRFGYFNPFAEDS